MPQTVYHPEQQIRTALIQRVLRFIKITGTNKSSFGECAVGDPALVGRLKADSGLAIDTYGRVMKFLDDNWPRRGSKARRA